MFLVCVIYGKILHTCHTYKSIAVTATLTFNRDYFGTISYMLIWFYWLILQTVHMIKGLQCFIMCCAILKTCVWTSCSVCTITSISILIRFKVSHILHQSCLTKYSISIIASIIMNDLKITNMRGKAQKCYNITWCKCTQSRK